MKPLTPPPPGIGRLRRAWPRVAPLPPTQRGRCPLVRVPLFRSGFHRPTPAHPTSP